MMRRIYTVSAVTRVRSASVFTVPLTAQSASQHCALWFWAGWACARGKPSSHGAVRPSLPLSRPRREGDAMDVQCHVMSHEVDAVGSVSVRALARNGCDSSEQSVLA